MRTLPIETLLPDLRRVLAEGRHALVTAPPGAGKTTVVPLALMDEPWLHQAGVVLKLIMLEPRRLAARAAAHRMAATLGEAVGDTVGYRVRLDSKVGPRTRIEVVTEGILTRLLQHDPSLAGYGLVLFDEFHERSLHADLGLALSLEARRLFRPDLRLLVMSATLDCAGVVRLLGEASVLSCEGRVFPVETAYLDRPVSGPIEPAVVHAVTRALTQEPGSLLVFLPGMGEIRRTERKLQEAGLPADVLLAPLHGDLPQEAQDQAIAPAPPGRRKVVLATSIAETSLTIEGVRVVIDAGLLRVPRFDPRTGLTRLETIRVTQDSAEQRRGRAGRLEPGRCYRLWTAADHRTLAPRRPPEILESDLASLVLEAAVWGADEVSELSWLDAPPAGALAQARDLLGRLGALDEEGRVTAHGKRMAQLALHPRLAHMILTAVPLGLGPLACEVAALLSERDVIRTRGQRDPREADLRLRLDALRGEGGPGGGVQVDTSACARARRTAGLWQKQLKLAAPRGKPGLEMDRLGVLLAFAYPDRIAQRQGVRNPSRPLRAIPDPISNGVRHRGSSAARRVSAPNRYLLANGRGASFPQPDPLATEPYLVIAELDAGAQWARIYLAAPISQEDLERFCADLITDRDSVVWDRRAQTVRARRQRRLGALVLQDHPLASPDPALIATALQQGIKEAGLGCLPWTKELQQWRARVAFLRRQETSAATWPDLSDEVLLDRLEQWLGPFLAGLTRLDQVKRVDLGVALHGLLTREQQRQLDRLAPTHLPVPSGSRVRLNYDASERPILAVRLQEMFGSRETPRVVDGRVPVMVHLLSPAGRPVQVTQDLASFWAAAYQDVRKDLRGRYPKHHWPEDPLQTAPTRKPKARR